MDDIYNLALFDRSAAEDLIRKVRAGIVELDGPTTDHLLSATQEGITAELDEVLRIDDPRLYEINNVTDSDFVRSRNRARRDHNKWSMFVDNFIGDKE